MNKTYHLVVTLFFLVGVVIASPAFSMEAENKKEEKSTTNTTTASSVTTSSISTSSSGEKSKSTLTEEAQKAEGTS